MTGWLANPKGPEWDGIGFIAAGGAIVLLLSYLRTQQWGFVPHPVGMAVGPTFGLQCWWFSFFLGWLFNRLLTHWGGRRAYAAFREAFLGFVLGDAIAGAVSGFLSAFHVSFIWCHNNYM